MLLHDEHPAASAAEAGRFAEWLGGAFGTAFAPVFFERHHFRPVFAGGPFRNKPYGLRSDSTAKLESSREVL